MQHQAASLGQGLVPYRLTKPDKQPLNAALGAPDFFPLFPVRGALMLLRSESPFTVRTSTMQGCPEDALTQATIRDGYKGVATDLGISEAREHESVIPIMLGQVASRAARSVGDGEWGPSRSICQNLRKVVMQQLVGIAEKKRAAAAPIAQPPELGRQRRPPEQPAASSDDTACVCWLHELAAAGGHSLSHLSTTVPYFPNRQLLLQGLWHCQVPASRATWLVRILYTNWAAAPSDGTAKSSDPCSSLWTRHILEALEAQLEAQVGSFFYAQVQPKNNGPFSPECRRSSTIRSLGLR